MNNREPDAEGSAASPSHSQVGLTPDVLNELRTAGTPRRLPRGSVLVEAGSRSDAFFIVLSGRFHVMVGERPIAEIVAGEPIGEISFFAGGDRTATVVAARASEVLEIGKSEYDSLAARVPALPAAILSSLADRLRRGVTAAQSLSPVPGEILGILPAAGGQLDHGFAASLIERMAAQGEVINVVPGDLPDGQGITDWMAQGHHGGRRVVVSCHDPEAEPKWAEEIAQNADTLLFVLDRRTGTSLEPSHLETSIAKTFLPSSVHLALLHGGTGTISGTAQALEGRGAGLHHHIRDGRADDLDRLSRFLLGEATGIVFGGGGAFGVAHLAILKALSEHGFAFDMVGGASIGATMAAVYAMDLDPDEVIDRFDALFVKAGVMKRLTVPKYSIIDHTYFDAQLQMHFEDWQVEDLPLNFYAVATSLTRNDLAVIRRGPLWRAARASSSIPAVFPPVVLEDGEVLIDGAYFDNVPVSTMRQLKPGRNLVLSLAAKSDWRVMTDYRSLPGRGRLLAQTASGGLLGRIRFPGIFSIMTRSMIVNSEKNLATLDRRDDVFLPIPPMKGMGFLGWPKARNLFDATYASSSAALKAIDDDGGNRLQAFADQMSLGADT